MQVLPLPKFLVRCVITLLLLVGFWGSLRLFAYEDTPADSKSAGDISGLIALYDFSQNGNNQIPDLASYGNPLNLYYENSKALSANDDGITLSSNTLISSRKPASKILEAVKKTGELTLEVWFRPANTSQNGPARIITFSHNSLERNFTIGQEKDKYEIRLRTTKTNSNGMPALISKSKSVSTKPTHLVFSRYKDGTTKLFLNGKFHRQSKSSGDFSNWNKSWKLGVGNEFTKDRTWKGSVHFLAIYNRGLDSKEINAHYKKGYKAGASLVKKDPKEVSRALFTTKVAEIFADRCFECHDTATQKGGLDLSRKTSALKGNENGNVLIPQKPDASRLWQVLVNNEMPHNRAPLLPEEKKIIHAWILGGAEWPLPFIDPANFKYNQSLATNWLRRLTVREYIATVKSTFNIDIKELALRELPPDLRADGFRNTAYNLNVDLKHIEAYGKLAEHIVSKLDVLQFASQFKKGKSFQDKHMLELNKNMGKWVLRGPLTDYEVTSFRGIASSVAHSGGSYEEAVKYTLMAMLQSPRFLYHMEDQQNAIPGERINQFELANRMSYLIWGSSPDKELMKAANDRKLTSVDDINTQIERMLKHPLAIERSCHFLADWLNLNHLDYLDPDPKHFPTWNKNLAEDMKTETLTFFKHVVWKEKRPLADLLQADYTFLTPKLAKHYGITPQGDGVRKYDLSKNPHRGGILTHGSLLTIGGDEASMVTRGLFVLNDMLRGVIKDPPPCVDTTPVPTKAGVTQRTMAISRIKNEACGGCHKKFETLAFGLEKFDGTGAFSESDRHGNKLRDDGEVLFPGSAKPVTYTNSAQLMKLLATHERIKQTITWKLVQFSMGRPLSQRDATIVDNIHKQAQQNGGTYSSVISAIILSDLVLKSPMEN